MTLPDPASLALLSLCSALLTIASDWQRRRPTFYVLKPLTTLLIVGIAVQTLAGKPEYQQWIVAGLALCLGGDIALMFHSNRAFMAGLAAFLLAHLLFAAGFFLDGLASPAQASPIGILLGIPLIAITLQLTRWLLPRTGRLKGPVLIYLVALALMVNAAGLRAGNTVAAGGWLAYAGAVLFAVSDTVLAYRKFVRVPVWGQPATLAAYYLAIGLLAWAH